MPRRYYTKEQLLPIINKSITWAQVCRELGIQPATGSQTNLKKRAIDFGIDFSHFVGNRFNKGKIAPNRKPIEYYLNNRTTINSNRLKHRLIEEGIKNHCCERCNATEWMGDPIPLELDHKDSDHWNNDLNNIWIICPNCHFQETAKRLKKRRADRKIGKSV